MAEKESPLIQALPPESDYYTYLTIVEYNLSQESLPILHRVLQDETLTTNIGWDLVQLLVPYLPESEQCLHDIARLGNPREVILKATESLRLIEYSDAEGSDDGEQPVGPGATDARVRADSSTYPLKTAQTFGKGEGSGSTQAVELPPPLPLATSQFIYLLSMLSTLHGRIKTKNPSRFLSTTLQAILASFSNSATHREEMVRAIVPTVKAVAGAKGPTLPNRRSSGMLGRSPHLNINAPASDPEALEDSEVTPQERSMQRRLLQSFISHVVEEYLLNVPSTDDDVPGMAWSSRVMEKMHPERIIPETDTLTARFAKQEQYHRRIDAVGQLVTLAQDLNLTDEDLLAAAIAVEKMPERRGDDEDDPPSSADDIPLSRLGSLMLYTARQASSILYDASTLFTGPPFAIFPDHHELVKHCLSSPEQGTGTLGSEPEALIDAILALGIVTLEHDAIGEPASDEQFNEYLQTTALLSSNCPSPNLRGHAHYLTSTILRSHPDDAARLAFVKDTLEHCPFENLKVSAVGWVKGETIEANPPTVQSGSHQRDHTGSQGPASSSVFATPIALDSLSPFLFPSLQADLLTTPVHDAWITYLSNLSFYLASLNFLYLLLCAKHVHESLLVHDLWNNTDMAGSFLQPLRDASKRFLEAMERGGELVDEKSEEVLAEMNVLNDALERVTGAVKFLNA
ncbi:YAP1-binding protein 1 [Vermiconidia calcicola]|uniref:YAP1-binding protein 1 n=1 Tax=Vermiconidia calcicola TaxID=1690605 RepID=A0ACC3MGM8_9PEZI|nr:YAP1-binding protein 1 [Vermiconidia calcicola]